MANETGIVESGAQALDIMRQRASTGFHFALILLDAQMPVMDGFAVAARSKSRKILPWQALGS